VGENLYEALRTLREIPEIQMGTSVLVDALCINQQDVEERNFEVKRMSDIYTRAKRAISYPGEEQNIEDDAVDFLHILSLKDDDLLKCIGEWWLLNPSMVSGEPGAAIHRFYLRCLSRFSEEFVALHGQ
jgi:Heterokaryon incompatibility protein (HET)